MKPRSIEQAKVVADVMTRRVVTLFEEDDLEQIDEAMERFRFRHVPVVDGDRLVGLVTRTELGGASSSRFDPTGHLRDDAARKCLFVREVMTTNVRTVHPDTSIAEAARLMRDEKIGCLPVVEADQTLVGIVTSTDMLDLIAGWLARRELEELDTLPGRRPPFPGSIDPSNDHSPSVRSH